MLTAEGWLLSVSISIELHFVSHFIVAGISIAAPGGVDDGLDTEEFYEFLQARGSGIVTVPKDRWNAEAFLATQKDHPGKIATVSNLPPLCRLLFTLRFSNQTKGGYIPNFVRHLSCYF
jgi:fatty acid synthase, animal type